MDENFSTKFQEEISCENFRRLRNYLEYFYHKNEIRFLELKNDLTRNSTSYLLNIHKYLLLALSFTVYYCKLCTIIKQIHEFQVKIPEGII